MAYYFGQVKNLIAIWLTLGKSKKISAFSLYKTPLGETGCLGIPYFFTCWLPKHPVFWFTPLFSIQPVRLPLATYLWLYSTCVTYRTSCYTIGHQVLPTSAFNVIPRPSMSYRKVFRPILYFQPSSSQSDLRLCINPNLAKGSGGFP